MTVQPPPSNLPVDSPLRTRTRDLATLYYLALAERLYAVVDTAGDGPAYERMLALGPRARCLYFGAEGARYAAIAPWLVRVDRPVYDWILDTLEPAAPDWGVFLVSGAAPLAIARQLRRWLTVRLPDGDAVRFRFYDPRILFDFLVGCTPAELHAFYGAAIEAFVAYDAPTRDVVVYDRADTTVALPRRRVVLPTPPSTPADPASSAFVAHSSDTPFPLGLSADRR